jgi:hypothetical protein
MFLPKWDAPGTLLGMIKDIGLEKDEFFQLLSEL